MAPSAACSAATGISSSPTRAPPAGWRATSIWTYHDHIVHDFRILLLDARWQVVGQVHWAQTDKLDMVLAALPDSMRTARRAR